jgi:four helix bundle protein
MRTTPIHEKLLAWQVAIDLATATYRMSARFPTDERYGLTSQVRRAAISISSNIAEGTGRASRKEAGYFLYIARGSLREVQSLIAVAERLGYATSEHLEPIRDLCDQASKLIGGLVKSARRNANR